MFSHVIYAFYSDNVSIESDVSVDDATIESGYTASGVADNDATEPTRLVDSSGFFKFAFDDAVGIKIAALIHSNYVEGMTIHIQGNHTDSWGAPAFDTTMQMPQWRAGRFPPNPWKRLDTISGWDAFEFWRVGTTAPNDVAVTVGEIILAQDFKTANVQWNDKPAVDRPQIEHKTAYKRLRTPLGTAVRSLTGVIPADDDGADDIDDWVQDADGRPVLFIPESEVPEAWLAIHTTTRQETNEEFDDANFLPLAMEEQGRGLEPTPSPLV